MSGPAAAARYVAFLEAMTPADLGRLAEFCVPEVRFRDPFNDVTGIEAYRSVLAKMFEDTGQPDFKVTRQAVAGEWLYLRWRFVARGPGGKRLWIEGMSEIRFDAPGSAGGKVIFHGDFWDAGQVYELVPLLRSLVRLVKRRLSKD